MTVLQKSWSCRRENSDLDIDTWWPVVRKFSETKEKEHHLSVKSSSAEALIEDNVNLN